MPDPNPDLLVVCLCAAWCDTCGEFREGFENLKKTFPKGRFVWLDVEDDAALVGDVDVENFPTLAVYRCESPVFFGVTLPQEGVVSRTIAGVVEGKAISVPPAIAALPRALAERVRP